MSDFRTEVFGVCNCIKKDASFDELRRTIHSLVVSNNDSIKFDNKKEIASNGIRLCCGFYGILLAFENRLTISQNAEPIKLTEKEFYHLSFGNYVINLFVDLCLEDVTKYNKTIGKVLRPYSFYKQINNVIKEFDFDGNIFSSAVSEFKRTKIYNSIINSGVLNALSSIPEKEVFSLLQVLERDIINIPMENVPQEVFEMAMKRRLGKPDKQTELSFLTFKLLALREMLKNACRLLYAAILGNDLPVFDNNCLIDIKNNSHNFIYRFKTIIVQGLCFLMCDELIGNVMLFDLELDNVKEHDFGIMRSITTNFSQEEGNKTTISFCTVDKELNPIYTLTD